MADSTLQITPGAGGVYARVLQGPTIDEHATLIPYHMSLDGGPGWIATQTYTTSTDMTTATAITAAPTNGTVFLPFRSKLKLATADKKLFGKASVAGNVRITCFYHSEV